MNTELPCYHCGNPPKKGQSYYSNHGVQVCLDCFKISRRCIKCKFPSKKLIHFEGIGEICEFCQKEIEKENLGSCHICKQRIYKGASVYEAHGVSVCLKCFKTTPARCFFCRFPKTTHRIKGLGKFCEFCEPTLIHAQIDVQALLKPLETFVTSFATTFPKNISFEWVTINQIIKLQKKSNIGEGSNFEDLSNNFYPLLYHSESFFIIERIQSTWLLPLFAGQAVAADLCRKYKLKHLLEDTPFHEAARGWCHWISFFTAKTLKYEKTFKSLQRNVCKEVSGNFPKFIAMSEYRKVGELIEYSNSTLEEFARKYL